MQLIINIKLIILQRILKVDTFHSFYNFCKIKFNKTN